MDVSVEGGGAAWGLAPFLMAILIACWTSGVDRVTVTLKRARAVAEGEGVSVARGTSAAAGLPGGKRQQGCRSPRGGRGFRGVRIQWALVA